MFVSNIASLAVAKEICDPYSLATGQTNNICYRHAIANISSLRVINDITFHIDINKNNRIV